MLYKQAVESVLLDRICDYWVSLTASGRLSNIYDGLIADLNQIILYSISLEL